ncbi:amino acid/amide ABC transporter substrate-binding protein, HAAT family [Noviherbaspirillum humi]|uniref:Amino acid/amide ABC transporter substrate-binding protein, HAAT family n=1 Tax=Noviherbaspirillum humi TaxID=1688639 RepID=A0A239F0B4_9BURK|nr:ABC transporter substrate-binding protein [Noviherbaspirillum humi]SNS50366.1 amino acid/amide ABC transporter substrate-binding protein, HAAT family [Noviherbaspirillum humi]
MKRTMKIAAAALIAAAAPAAMADVKVGFLATLSGPSGEVGRDQLDGFMLALEHLGGKLGGVPATVLKEDEQQKPEAAMAAVTKFLDKDKVDVVAGLTFANVLMALQNKIASTEVPFIGTVAGPSPTAGAQCKPNLFVMSWQSDVPAEAVGKYLTDKGVKRVSTLTPNFVGGKDKISGFKRFYKGEVVDEIYTPLNQLDFSAEITQISASKPDAIYTFYPGALAVTFVRQYQQAGLTSRIPFYSSNMIEGGSADAMGAAAIGAVVGDTWTPGMPNPESRRFVSAYERKYNRTPSAYAAFSYDAAMMLNSAIESIKGNVADRKALNRAIKNAQFKSVRGNFKFGHNNYPVQDYHIFQVVKGAGPRPEFKLLEEGVLKGHADAYADKCDAK